MLKKFHISNKFHAFSPLFLSSHIVEYQEQEGGLNMRFLYKRQPANELQLEIQDVRDAMCSGKLVLFDLLFYSFIFAILIMPTESSLPIFGGLFLLIYLSFASLFLIVRKVMDNRNIFNDFGR